MRGLAALGAATLVLTTAPSPLRAQIAGMLQPQVRVDVIAARRTALQAGAGVSMPLGIYARLDLVGGIGADVGGESSNSRHGVSGRGDVVARYLFDPLREKRIGVYAGGGLGARYDPGPRWRGLLVALLGVEGKPGPTVVPFFEVGYGGGLRIGGGMRKSFPNRR